ncbi:MAG: hypothetical protein CVT98_03970 [Bacteroidetes bacterium HGW-Bacteroidetes-15]|nr:MAG: hypothetical protein CVT98_03970 [Bacteroidetes bacterium HGW-Bacteroidetes-15]
MNLRIYFKNVILLIGFMLFVFSTNSVIAQQNQEFIEAFDDSNLPNWERAPEVIVTDGYLRIGPGQFAARMGIWENFTLQFSMKYAGEGETHVNIRTSDNGGYLVLLTPNEILLIKNTPESEPEVLANSTGAILNGSDWFAIQIDFQGNALTVSINGEKILNATDPNPLTAGGLVFVSTGQRTTDIDDLSMQISETITEPEQQPVKPEQTVVEAIATTTEQPGIAQTWETFLQSLSSTQGSTLTTDVFVVNLLLAVVFSFVLGRVYVYWGGSLSNRRKFAANFMLVTVTTTFIILVVRSSIALSLGLVGALSIIRFRAAIKEPEELAYLFFAISLGIGLGDNQRLISVITLAVVVVIIGLARLLRQTQADVNLHLTISSNQPEKITVEHAMDILSKHTEKLRLLRFDETPQNIEMSFVVEFRHLSDLNKAKAGLKELSQELNISFLDNKGIW